MADINAVPPSQWQDVVFLRGTAPTDIMWGGSIVNVQSQAWERNVFWQAQASDWAWLLDRYKLVTGTYYQMGANTMMASIVRDYTDGGFRPGYCPSDLGVIAQMRFDGVPVSQALNRIAKTVQAYFRIRPDKRIDIARTFPEGNAITVTNASVIRELAYEESGALVANRVTFIGRGSRVATIAAPGATTIYVEDASVFAAGGGLVRVNDSDVSYTGRDDALNALTGCAGLAAGADQGVAVRVMAVAEDPAAQTALASALGGGRSGLAEVQFSDDALTDAEVRGKAESYLAFYKDRIPGASYVAENQHYKVGKIVTFSLTDPMAISGEMRVQDISIFVDEDVMPWDTLPRFQYRVGTRLGRRAGILDIIVQR